MNSTAKQNTTESTINGSYTDDTSQSAIHRRYVSIIAVYCVIVLVSLVGNSLVLAVVYRNENKRMRTISNYFIVNISCSDLFITLCNSPSVISSPASGQYVPVAGTGGDILCKLIMFLFYLSIEVSLLSLVAISVDRFLLVFYPLKTFMTTKRAQIFIGTIWLTGTIFTAPLAAQALVYEHGHLKYCFLNLSWNIIRAYFIFCLLVFVILPLTTMVVLYMSILVKLFHQKTPGANSAVNQEHSNKRNHKVLSMLVTIVTLTFVCWLPFWSANMDCMLTFSYSSCNSLLYLLLLAFANCALNPCVYVIFNEHFRLGFYRIFCSLFCPSWIRSSCRNRVNDDSLSARDN